MKVMNPLGQEVVCGEDYARPMRGRTGMKECEPREVRRILISKYQMRYEL